MGTAGRVMVDERTRVLAIVVEVLGLLQAQRRRARHRRRVLLVSADDGAHVVVLFDSAGRMGDRRITRNVARFSGCANGRWPAGAMVMPGDTGGLLRRDGVDVLELIYGQAQKAVVAMDVLPMLEAEAKERQGARIDLETSVKKLTDVEPRSTRASEQAAQMVGTNRQYVSDAKRLSDEAPELLERVRSGESTCSS